MHYVVKRSPVRDQLGFDVERAISEWERNLEELGIGPVSLTYEEERVPR